MRRSAFVGFPIDTDFRYFTGIEYSGDDYTGVVPPDPISNSEVKYSKADGSALRESR